MSGRRKSGNREGARAEHCSEMCTCHSENYALQAPPTAYTPTTTHLILAIPSSLFMQRLRIASKDSHPGKGSSCWTLPLETRTYHFPFAAVLRPRSCYDDQELVETESYKGV